MKKFLIKSILNRFLLIGFVFIASCKPMYYVDSSHRNYTVYSNYDFLKPINIKYESNILFNNKKYSISGIIKTNKSNQIYISGYSSSYGIEVFKMLFSKDSIYLVDKLNRKYFEGSEFDYTYLNTTLFNKQTIMNMLLGYNIFDSSSYAVDNSFFDKDLSFVTYKCKDSNLNYQGNISYNTNYILKNQHIKDKKNDLFIEYLDYFKKKKSPRNIAIKGIFNKSPFEISMIYNEVEISKEEPFYINKPKNFTQFK